MAVRLRTVWLVFFLCLNAHMGVFLVSGLVSAFLEELKSINYEVDIVKTPVRKSAEQTAPTLQIRSKYGQMYQCVLPELDEIENSDKKEDKNEETIDVRELLKPIEMNPCLLKAKDWWTYEFCYGHYVKQYHIEDGKIIGPVITLGLYESDYDWSNETEEAKFQHLQQRYHSQTYSNGSRCDLTGLPRNMEVRFFCEEDAGDYILRVDEPGTCSYVLTIHTSRLCTHPKLKPLPSTKAHLISCSPFLDDEQYSLFIRKVEEEKILAENKRNEWLSNQQERLKALKIFPKSNTKNEEMTQSESLLSKSSLERDEDVTINAITNDNAAVDDDVEDSVLSSNNNLPNKKSENRAVQNDIEKWLVKEYDQEIQKLKAMIPPERFASVKNDIEKHIDNLFTEVEEIGAGVNEEDKETVYSKLDSSLNSLLEKLERAEKDVVKAAKHLQQTTIGIEKTVDELVDYDSINEDEDYDDNEYSLLQDSNAERHSDPGKFKFTESDNVHSDILDDDKLHVRIRRLDRKSPDSAGELHEMDFAQRTKLEQAIKEKLEKSGVDTGGRRIEVKIITAGYYDNEDGKDFHALSDDETVQFQNMIMALLTGQQEAVQEMERHKKLEENYKFVWGANGQYPIEEEE